MSLFGQSTATTTQTKPSLFGSLNTTQPQQQNTGSSVFGGFGQQNQQQQQQQTQPTTSLFGASLQPAQNQQTSSIFGAPAQNNNQQSGGLFGASTQQPQQQSSIFGQTNQQQQQPQQASSLFGASTQPQQQQQSLFGGSTQPQQQQQQQQQLTQSTRAPLWQPGSSISARGKTIPEQMQVLYEKWNPESNTCSFQHYFYNNVQPETVPYYGPGPGEDEQAWEEALAKKPHDGAIPVLCKGFSALGNRLRIQVEAVTALQARLHEINNSLTAMLQNHDLDISIRTVDARRRHATLSQRSLQLATKVQILRNRGYVMDRAEEELKRKLAELERGVFDPQLSGRQEEIWARMVGIRERARFLQQETDTAGSALADGQGEALDEETMKTTNKILTDYDAQISHLHRELEASRKELEEWQGGPAGVRT